MATSGSNNWTGTYTELESNEDLSGYVKQDIIKFLIEIGVETFGGNNNLLMQAIPKSGG